MSKHQRRSLIDLPSSTALTKEKVQYLRIRNLCGFLGVILPWLALFSAGISQPHPSDQWWWSISATYYQSPALAGILTPAAIVLMCYIGYDTRDNVVTSLSGIAGLGIVLFPCKVSWFEPATQVGFFQLPMVWSNYVHCGCAVVFFLLLAYNSICLFTQSDGNMTDRKRLRNRIYRICGWSMVGVMAIFVLCTLLDAPGWTTMLVEILLLHLFGITWLVKGEAFPFLNDKPEETA